MFKLIGACNQDTISIENRGVLTLDGIIVTHENGEGRGVTVEPEGELVLSSGEISGNTAYTGGGVFAAGSFSMSGGRIFNNTAHSGVVVYLFFNMAFLI